MTNLCGDDVAENGNGDDYAENGGGDDDDDGADHLDKEDTGIANFITSSLLFALK